ncbi:MAG TPA: alpha/beta hydrolase [Caulobacteraceae bacterium]|jgi:acetyl esterase/lipase
MASERDVVFANAGETELKLDIYPAEGEAKRAAILYFHGGGWRGGSREAMRPDARAMAERGYVGLPAQYRLLGEAPYPACLHDVKAAIRWTRANAGRLGIDEDKIILWGSSAGAHLALLAGGTPDNPEFEGDVGTTGVSSAVAAVIAVHPPTSFYVGAADPNHSTAATSLLGDNATEAQARAVSPMTHVTEAYPPTLFLHGTSDRVVHHSASQRMLDALRLKRAPADLQLYHGHNHGFCSVPSMRALVAAQVDYFLQRTIIDKAKFDAEILENSMFAQRAAAEASAAATAS